MIDIPPVFDQYFTAIEQKVDEDKQQQTYDNLFYSDYQISTEWGEQVNEFNQNIAVKFDLPKVIRYMSCDNNETCNYQLSFKDRQVKWSENPNPNSDVYEVLKLTELVYPEVEIRIDINAMQFSDLYFYGLPPSTWQSLTDKYGNIVNDLFIPVTEAGF